MKGVQAVSCVSVSLLAAPHVTTHRRCFIDALQAAAYLAKVLNGLCDVGKNNDMFMGIQHDNHW
jgi:hypothetical protein